MILSGHEVPGEGEHKIMDYIRSAKLQPDYDANTRHCMYGLDADLVWRRALRSEKMRHMSLLFSFHGFNQIILGLVSHEPRFTLLREEVKFGKQSKKVGLCFRVVMVVACTIPHTHSFSLVAPQREASAEETTFHLLSLSLYREYLALEFADLKASLPFEFDIERLLDDWVLLGFLVGNDFLPHLPHFHIGEVGEGMFGSG